MQLSPKVSIIIPVHNGSDFLRETIDSALSQTYNNTEILVINDGSTDDGKTDFIAKSYGQSIRYFHKENGGVASALNLGISQMAGDFFSWLSHDDLYCPEKIEINLEYIKKFNETVIVFSDYEQIDEKGNSIEIVQLQDIEPSRFQISLITNRALHGCSLLIPKECFSYISNFNEKLRTVQDYDLWVRMASCYKFVHIPKVLIKSRQHPNQDSRKIASIHHEEKEKLFVSLINTIPTNNLKNYTKYKSLALTYTIMGKEFAKGSNLATSRYLLKKSLVSFNFYDLRVFHLYTVNVLISIIHYIITGLNILKSKRIDD